MTIHLVKWVPIRAAWELRSLQQGALNVGNTRQNRVNLVALATTEANGPRVWAKWGSAVNDTKTTPRLYVNVKKVPGYVPPIGTND